MSEVLHLYTESRDRPVARLDLARAELTVVGRREAPVEANPVAVRQLIDSERYLWQLRVASP
jgi:hypothetical protein